MIIYVGVYIGNGEKAVVVYDCEMVKRSESNVCWIPRRILFFYRPRSLYPKIVA